MKILVLGSGGREHALASVYAKSRSVKQVYVAPGNDFMKETSSKIQPLTQVSSTNFDQILETVKKYKIDIVDVAPDDPIAYGFVDKLQALGIKAFGPTKKAAELEWSKAWSRAFMEKYNLPIPVFKTLQGEAEGIAYLKTLPEQPLFIKASGLAGGKGAIYAATKKDALTIIRDMKQFGAAGKTYLIEECMMGEEFSLFAICDGLNFLPMCFAQDHKSVYNAGFGPNTGGMGCVAPSGIVTRAIVNEIKKKILTPLMKGMIAEGRPYKGILYLGGMTTKDGVKIIEFNCRWGDPEAEVILPGLKTNYLQVVNCVMHDSLEPVHVAFDNKVRVSVTGVARGYPDNIEKVKGKKVLGLLRALGMPGVQIFGAGLKKVGKYYTVDGGRVFHIVGEGATIQQARERAYSAMSQIFIEGNNLEYRTDIGWRDLERLYS